MDLASQPGVHCSLKQCSRISFLPINCVDCSLQFCEEHYLSDQHDCSSPSSKTLTDQELTQRLIEKNQRAGTLSGRLPCQAPKCKGFSLHIEREEQGINFKHQAPRCERCRGLFCMRSVSFGSDLDSSHFLSHHISFLLS